MAQSTYPLTGIQTGLGPQNDPLRRLPLRREIDEWWASNNPDDINQKSLFINALDAFQRIDPNNMLSYFQIAGTADWRRYDLLKAQLLTDQVSTANP